MLVIQQLAKFGIMKIIYVSCGSILLKRLFLDNSSNVNR